MDSVITYRQSNWLRWMSWVLWALALAGLIYLAGLTVWLGVTGLFFPYQLDYGEGFMLHLVKEWSQGRPIYKGAEGYPYVMANYPPLTIVLGLALTPILGITYAAGRVWTLLAIAAVAAVLVAWVRWFGYAHRKQAAGRWLPAVTTGLIFVGSPYIYHWAPLFRVDLTGLALTLGGLYVVLLACPPAVPFDELSGRASGRGLRAVSAARGGKAKKGLLWLAAVLFVAGLYAKQSFLFAPAAALAYLFFFVDRWQAITMAVAMAVLGGGLFLLINIFTNGGFWYGLVASNVNPFLWPEFWRQQADFFGTFAVLGLLTAWYVLDKFFLDRATPLRDKVSPVDFYLVAALVSLGFAGKAGAWENYFFEALVVLTLCGGLGLARIGRHGTRLYQIAAPLLVLVQAGLMWHTPGVANDYLRLTRQSNEAIAPILAGTSDPIASEDMGLLVTNDKVLDYCSFQYSQLARAGRWDQAWELGQLRDRNFSRVILEEGTRLDVDRYQRFTREFVSELDRNYRRAQKLGKYELYEPDPLQHERQADFSDQLSLVGWSLHAPAYLSDVSSSRQSLEPGDTVSLTVVWQAQQAMATEYTAFAHLVDERGQGWAGDDHQPHDGLYPTSAWGTGEMVRDVFTLTVPADAPPGLYSVQVGWYEPTTQERLPVGEGTTFRVAVLPVSWVGTGPQAVSPLDTRFGEAITLEGYAWEVDPGMVQVTLRWAADAFLDTDYTVFVHLVDPEDGDRMVAQGDAPPLGGRWPTSLWLPGVRLDDVHAIPLPADPSDVSSSGRNVRPGTYDLLVGLYDPRTAERLLLPDGSDAVRLVGVDVGG